MMIILGSSITYLSDLVTIFMIMMPFHKISTPTGATTPVQKVKENSSRVRESIEELLEGFWGYMIGNMIAVFFVLCQILGKMQHGQIRYMQIINFSYFVW